MSGHIGSAAQIPARMGMPPHVGKYLRDEKILLHNPGCPACRRRFLGKALLEHVVAPSPQCGEKYSLFFCVPLGGIHGQGILPVIPLEFQGKKHQPFFRTQPKKLDNDFFVGLCCHFIYKS